FYARALGGRRSLRPPDATLESQDAPLHLHGAGRYLHHRPPADLAAAGRSARLRTEPRRAWWLSALRRYEEAEPDRGRGAGEARRHALRQSPLARRAADELADDLGPHRSSARVAASEGGGTARSPSRPGAHLGAGGARE